MPTALSTRIVNQNVEPAARVLETRSSPPIRSTSSLEMASPKPVPPKRRFDEAKKQAGSVVADHFFRNVALDHASDVETLLFARTDSTADHIGDNLAWLEVDTLQGHLGGVDDPE